MPALRSRWWGVVAAVWASLFAVLHLFWALGGSAGLTSSAGEELAEERPGWLVAGGLWGVAALLLIATALALALALAPTHGRGRHLLQVCGTAVGLLLLARGVGLQVLMLSGAYDGNAAITPGQRFWSILLWNPWFAVGGAAFCLAAWAFTRALPGRPSPR
ncbi:DUF3995 domain-containing protein [Blastococcus atacamensis]|uniref:DUF3995 domain-containing protein n=1 Tax=Blastococcus atacamensis TaxID=2070508 RepID=UPI000CECC75C|nr:DUF3995 domain-containing protein [Blastococcus atacamensis]